MTNFNLKRPQTWLKSKGSGISLHELVCYTGVVIYYSFVVAYMTTIIIAGWKYILS